MHFLAPGQTDVQFDPSLAPMEIERNQRIPLALHGTHEAIEFASGEQQLAGPGWIRVNVRRYGCKRRDLCAQQPGFARSQVDITLCDLRPAGPQALDLPALEGEARFERFLYRVIESRFLVLGDTWRGSVFFTVLFHGYVFAGSCPDKGPRLYARCTRYLLFVGGF